MGNLRWVMEFMHNEIRAASEGLSVGDPGYPWARLSAPAVAAGRRLSFGLDTDGDNSPDTNVWYWIGNGGPLGDVDKIYRGVGLLLMGPGGANSNRQEMANFIVSNPDLINNVTGFPPSDGNPDRIFIVNNGLVTTTLTVRPQPTQASTLPGNRDYTLRTRLRTRN